MQFKKNPLLNQSEQTKLKHFRMPNQFKKWIQKYTHYSKKLKQREILM